MSKRTRFTKPKGGMSTGRMTAPDTTGFVLHHSGAKTNRELANISYAQSRETLTKLCMCGATALYRVGLRGYCRKCWTDKGIQ